MAHRWKYKNPLRIGLQILILVLIGYVAVRPLFGGGYVADFEAYCPFGGLSSLASRLNMGTMSCTMSEVQIFLGLGLLVGVIVVGKLFCSFLCPIGSVTEWLGLLGKNLKIRMEMPAKVDRPLRLLKYALLFVTLYLTMTSSELFCKEYDPYFAVATLFQDTDITLAFAITATVLTVLGAIVFRLFWCKYLCPLSALSNIFLNVTAAALVIGLYVLANLLGAGLGLVWVLGGLVLVGAVTELGFLRSFWLPAAKITRNTDTCTNCGECDDQCPQGIRISDYTAVTHTDCNLCTDCVYACPLKNTLTISRKGDSMKYLAPVAAVILVAVSLGASSKFEFTTIEERWGGFDSLASVQTFEMSGLKNVKCYGSAMSVKQKLQSVHGIYGLDAYASSHTVRVYYNPGEISETSVRKSLFTSSKQKLRDWKKAPVDSLAVMQIGIYDLFDLIDFTNLAYTLREDEGVAGFETQYGEPVVATIYFDRARTDGLRIRSRIEAETVTVKKPTGEETLELDFSCEDEWVDLGTIPMTEYRRRIFRPYDREFNGYEEYTAEQLHVWVFRMPEADAPPLRRFLASLSSHLSADEGVVRLSTRYLDGPTGLVFFDPAKTSGEKVRDALTRPMLTVFRTETKTESFKNPFHLPKEGSAVKAAELQIDEE